MLKKKKEPINVCGKDNNVRWNTETNDISVDCFGDTYSLPELIKVAYNGSLEELKDTRTARDIDHVIAAYYQRNIENIRYRGTIPD